MDRQHTRTGAPGADRRSYDGGNADGWRKVVKHSRSALLLESTSCGNRPVRRAISNEPLAATALRARSEIVPLFVPRLAGALPRHVVLRMGSCSPSNGLGDLFRRFGTEGLEVQNLSPRPDFPKTLESLIVLAGDGRPRSAEIGDKSLGCCQAEVSGTNRHMTAG